MSRLYFDSEEDQWRLHPVLPERLEDDFHTAESCCSGEKGPEETEISLTFEKKKIRQAFRGVLHTLYQPQLSNDSDHFSFYFVN